MDEHIEITMTDTPSFAVSGQQTPEIPNFTSSNSNYSWLNHDDGYYPVTPPDRNDLGDGDQSFQAFDVAPIDSGDKPLVAVMGVGYVGSHLISLFASRYNVLGFDISETKIVTVKKSYENMNHVQFTTNPRALTQATHFLIAVPTLLLPDKTVDSSYLREAIKTVGIYARPGATVVVESSVAVGMTRQLLGPLASARGIFVGMSPERVDPGRIEPPMRSIPKIVSGLDDVMPGSQQRITRLYGEVFDTIVPVSRPEVAEMTKLYENCQRMICIAYANEMADACTPHGIDAFEVCSAAATKPFGYLPFTPGLGVGGHCIPINPYYLLSNSDFPLLSSATEKMQQRPSLIAERALNSLFGSRPLDFINVRPRILVAGVGFKPGQSNLSNSPGLELVKSLVLSSKAEVMYADNLVEQSAVLQVPRLGSEDWSRDMLETFDLIIVAYKQEGIDLDILKELRGNVRVDMWCDLMA